MHAQKSRTHEALDALLMKDFHVAYRQAGSEPSGDGNEGDFACAARLVARPRDGQLP